MSRKFNTSFLVEAAMVLLEDLIIALNGPKEIKMKQQDIYNGPAWIVFFFDGFHVTSQLIVGETYEAAKAAFESQTGFKIQKVIEKGIMSTNLGLRNYMIKSNRASREVDDLFVEFEKRTGRKLTVSTAGGHSVIFEGVYPFNKLTKEFKNSFTCFIEMKEYFQKALPLVKS